MFSNTVQPSLVSLFSSTSSNPLQLFSAHVDEQLPEDSLICLVDDSTSEPPPGETLGVGKLIAVGKNERAAEDTGESGGERELQEWEGEGYTLVQKVLQIQSPTLRKTFIRCPPKTTLGPSASLGISLPHVHIQVRSLGREWSFEVGVVDRAGRQGVIRCSTFQKEPTLKPLHSPPLLHLPLRLPPLPSDSDHKSNQTYDPYASNPLSLTAWSTVSLNLPALMDGFGRLASTLLSRQGDEDDDDFTARRSQNAMPLPSAGFGSIAYVKVYATCRLRRIWVSKEARGDGENLPWEFGLYGK